MFHHKMVSVLEYVLKILGQVLPDILNNSKNTPGIGNENLIMSTYVN